MKKSLSDLVREAHDVIREGEFDRTRMVQHVNWRLISSQNYWAQVFGNSFTLLIFTVILWPHVPKTWLLVWAISVVVATLYGAFTIRSAYVEESSDPGDSVVWERSYFWANVALGCTWGLLAFLTYPAGLLMEEAIVVTGLIALVSCAQIANIAVNRLSPRSDMALSVSTLTPHAVGAFLVGEVPFFLMGGGLLFLIGFLYIFGRIAHKAQIDAINLWFDYLEVIDRLQMEIEEKEKTAKALELSNQGRIEANRMMSKFVSLVTHDLRSPLATSSIFWSRFDADRKSISEEDLGAFVKREVERLDSTIAMIDNILDVSTLNEGWYKTNLSNINANLLCDEVARHFDSLAKTKGVYFDNKLPEDFLVCADSPFLKQVITNLTSNALKFSGSGDVITFLKEKNEKGFDCIVVSDRGIGILDEDIPNLFRHDVRTTSIGTAGEKGKGFGLPLCNDIMTAMGGSLAVKSTKGSGSSFYIETPTD